MLIDSTNQLIEKKRLSFEKYKKFVEDHSSIYNECKKLRYNWHLLKEGRSAAITIEENYHGVNLSCYLAKDDSIEKDSNLFIEECELFLGEFGYELYETDEHVPGKWIRYHFVKGNKAVHIFMNYDHAESCKIVGTGEFEEKKKRVCV